MSVFRIAGVLPVAVIVLSLGCGSKTPTAPTYDNFTDVFSDGVLVQGSTVANPDFGPADKPHKFTVLKGDSTYPGSISVTVGFLSPSVAVFGIGLTTWNASTQSCNLPLQYTTYTGTLGVPVSATAPAGDYCVAIFDVGNVVGSSNYTMTVGHT